MTRSIAGLILRAIVRAQVALLSSIGIDDAVATVVRSRATDGALGATVLIAQVAIFRTILLAVATEVAELAIGGTTTVDRVIVLARAARGKRTGSIATVAFFTA